VKIQFKSSEVLILLAASVMSFLANLPDQKLGELVDKESLLAALAALVVVAMFRYLHMMMLLTISILVIGANLPAELAARLEISQMALMVSLGLLISVSLLNRALRLLPTETETEVAHARQALLAAIEKGDQTTVLSLLDRNIGVNFAQDGTTPLNLAARKGHHSIVQMLISHGAAFNTRNAENRMS
jgi:multidrug efflux pump subunit AcrA (membrane-fusion protein)